MTRLALGLILGLASLPALAETQPSVPAMTDAERAAFREEVRAYLLENPEVLIEAMDVLQARQEEADALRDVQMVASLNDEIFNNPNDWVGGNPEGDITLVEFMDYRCGYCRKAYEEVDQLIQTDGKIRFVVKEFPILGEASLMSAQFAIAVRQLHGDEAYAKVHDALMTLRGEPSPEVLGRLAGDLGLEAQPILDRMSAPEVMQVIKDNHALADKMQITGTPAFVLKDMVMRGYAPLDVMRDFVADARSDG
ncbi:DsbA family protein [Tabrizicola flagellatus]|uniref:DsbA family protein n=1 Tax=Tabrizicola flagellatus TaxID=2593021 RepID=UPI0011F0C76F|nr:DsbA family protein [Tabrizicola flagellatus]